MAERYDDDLLDETIEVYQPYYARTLTRDDAQEILGNLVGGLSFTGLTLYATHVKTAPKRATLKQVA